MGHAEDILSMLDAQRCRICGNRAVRGATVCLACVSDEDLLADALAPGAQVNPESKASKPPRSARTKRQPAKAPEALRAAGG